MLITEDCYRKKGTEDGDCYGDFIRGHLFHALLKTDVWVHFYSKLFKQ